MADRRSVRFPGQTWRDVQALPPQLRQKVVDVVFHLAEEPVPSLADPYPQDGPLPGVYELYLPADAITIWYVITPYQGSEVITILAVRTNT